MVDFYADWCEPCRALLPVLGELKNTFRHNIRILKVNVEYSPLLADQFRVKSIPTVMVFKSGNLQWIGEGAIQLPELTEILKKYITQA